MNMQEIRAIARETGIKPGKMSKIELVHSIQLSEGNFNCFATAVSGICDQEACVWQDDCFQLARKKKH